MRRALATALTTLALITTFSLTALAGHPRGPRPDETDTPNASPTQTAPGHSGLRGDGHLT